MNFWCLPHPRGVGLVRTGGYVAGILRERFITAGNTDEAEFRDGIYGLLVWALATLLTVLFLFMAVSASTRLAAPSGGTAGPSTSVAGENTNAFGLDRLFRGDRRQGDTADLTAYAHLNLNFPFLRRMNRFSPRGAIRVRGIGGIAHHAFLPC